MSDGAPSEKAGTLWAGRFDHGMAPEMVPLNLSLQHDRRFWRQDVLGSQAWAQGLGKAAVLTGEEVESIVAGLSAVVARLEAAGMDRTLPDVPDEDIHSLVERLLKEEIGEVAGKLHTGRSRNDQAATDFRMWTLEACSRVDRELVRLGRGLLSLAESSIDIIMPGYTHLQQAQPVRAAHWALSHVWPLLRDRHRLGQARNAVAVLPLGVGALAGCPFPIDREWLAQELGFDSISRNSLDNVGDRDWVADLLYAGAMMGVHVSRLSEDLMIFTSVEWGYLRLSDGFSTGSSIMPQKRNPDVAELARGKSGRLVGNLTAVLTLLKGLPTSYNRDLQEDKPLVFDTVDTLSLVLPALAGAMETAAFQPDRIRSRLDSQLLATDLADHLVRLGVPFRECHEVVGGLVRRAESMNVSLVDLPESDFLAAHEALSSGVKDIFDWEASVESRDLPGGTSRRAVEAQMEEVRALLTRPLG